MKDNPLPLPPDIIDVILTFLSNYFTLRATILSSKLFYNVFKMRSSSILLAVSWNHIGPALPQAIMVLRCIPRTDDSGNPSETPWEETDSMFPITKTEYRMLARNAMVVERLEDLFSSRHKDRTSQTSVLDSTESWRFRRAMYRTMLYTKVFPREKYFREYEDFEEDPDPDDLEEEQIARQELLLKFSSSDLRELHSVVQFLMEIATWTATSECGDSSEVDEDVIIPYGPTQILDAYEAGSIIDLIPLITFGIETLPPMLEGYISDSFDMVWEEREEEPPPDDATHWRSILESVRSDKDTCKYIPFHCCKCDKIWGFDLWNETNWDYLKGVSKWLHTSHLPLLFKANLINNAVDRWLRLNTENEPLFTSTLLSDIHRLRLPAYESWHKEDWMCEECIIDIIRNHLHIWYRERNRSEGKTIPGDCWYGYDCTTQHVLEHATRYDHFCEPTRSIDAVPLETGPQTLSTYIARLLAYPSQRGLREDM
ncbi:hypothetical protein FPV67DRAFT_1478700 [Lyophyllum atratum]|nr:hypothetical protein FPV67DRAFT_1478700 [Lyophyllum atratum]